MKAWLPAFAFALASLIVPSLAEAKTPAIAMEEFMVPTPDAGIQIYVRNKHPADMTRFRPERTLLFVHGATYPAHTAFDLQLGGQSWMDYIAARGFDVYLVDLRGYGKSTRPAEMDKPAAENQPIVRGDVAVRDIGTAVDFILQRRNLKKLNLLGWSWGTSLMASYAAENPAKVERLALYAPVWIRQTASLDQTNGPLGAYRTVTREQAQQRWLTGVPEDKKATLIPKGWFDAWADATFATDAWGQKQSPAVLRAPNGVVQDGAEYWSAGKPYWDPNKVTMPVLLIHAEWDRDTPAYMAQTLFPLLVNAPMKRYVQLGEGTHTIIMEKNRMQLFRAVQSFFEEGSRS
jgi:pimeloyl-ACP methyl ester carboxylesterase